MQEVCLGTEATDVSTVLERNSYTYVFTYFCMYVELNSAMRLKERNALGGSVVCIYIHILIYFLYVELNSAMRLGDLWCEYIYIYVYIYMYKYIYTRIHIYVLCML